MCLLDDNARHWLNEDVVCVSCVSTAQRAIVSRDIHSKTSKRSRHNYMQEQEKRNENYMLFEIAYLRIRLAVRSRPSCCWCITLSQQRSVVRPLCLNGLRVYERIEDGLVETLKILDEHGKCSIAGEPETLFPETSGSA